MRSPTDEERRAFGAYVELHVSGTLTSLAELSTLAIEYGAIVGVEPAELMPELTLDARQLLVDYQRPISVHVDTVIRLPLQQVPYAVDAISYDVAWPRVTLMLAPRAPAVLTQAGDRLLAALTSG